MTHSQTPSTGPDDRKLATSPSLPRSAVSVFLGKVVLVITIVYALAYATRLFELLVLRTDQGQFGEAFIHKLVGIVILVIAVRLVDFRLGQTGFARTKAVKNTLLGIGIGLTVFAIAYATELLLLKAQGEAPRLEFFVTAYGLAGNVAGTTTVLAVVLCLLFNLINVVMEEGMFRGFLTTLAMRRVSFMGANIIASVLFGLWHVAMPVRACLDGEMTVGGAIGASSVYVVTSFLMGFLLGLLTRMSGGLWLPMGVHFVNNTIINLLHVVTISGTDQMQAIRIGITQTLLCIVIVSVYLVRYRGRSVAAQDSDK